MVGYVLEIFLEQFRRHWLYRAIRNVQYSILHSSSHLFSILEMYNRKISNFFTPFGELGFSLHVMHEISALFLRKVPYEEYVPGVEKLNYHKITNLLIYRTY